MLKKFKPTTPSQRQYISLQKNFLTKNAYLKHLIHGFKRSYGRNNQGRKTLRSRGGGHKRLYRNIMFNRRDVQGHIKSIEYDPNRTAFIASVLGQTKSEQYYIIAPEKLKIGDQIESGENVEIRIGNSLPLRNIAIGSLIHNISLSKNTIAKFSRSAGTTSQLIQKTNEGFAVVRLPSGTNYKIPLDSFATIGSVSNREHKNKNYGKAGRMRWLNRRPIVRGVAKNPVDHPHGGGEGKTSGGRPSVSPTGRITKGQPTSKNRTKLKYVKK